MERISEKLSLYTALTLWHDRLSTVRDMSAYVQSFQDHRNQSTLLRVVDTWKQRVDLKVSERIVARVLDQRQLGSAWDVWVRAALVATYMLDYLFY